MLGMHFLFGHLLYHSRYSVFGLYGHDYTRGGDKYLIIFKLTGLKYFFDQSLDPVGSAAVCKHSFAHCNGKFKDAFDIQFLHFLLSEMYVNQYIDKFFIKHIYIE